MILIDSVYQKVLALANKEQRGYITPQEFNLFADQAQLEIFHQYFYDLSQLSRMHQNSDEYGNIKSNLQIKIDTFERSSTIANGATIANNIYKIGSVEYSGTPVEEIQYKDIPRMARCKKLNPVSGLGNFVYYTQGRTLKALPSVIDILDISYITKPAKPSWTYVVVNQKAMYDANNPSLQNFELHPSEETELVYRILGLAGISMKRPNLTQTAASLVQAQIQQEKQ